MTSAEMNAIDDLERVRNLSDAQLDEELVDVERQLREAEERKRADASSVHRANSLEDENA